MRAYLSGLVHSSTFDLPAIISSVLAFHSMTFHSGPPRWPSGKASALRAEDPGFESRLRRDFFGVESYQ